MSIVTLKEGDKAPVFSIKMSSKPFLSVERKACHPVLLSERHDPWVHCRSM